MMTVPLIIFEKKAISLVLIEQLHVYRISIITQGGNVLRMR